MLVDASGEAEPCRHRMVHVGRTIEVMALDLGGSIEALRGEVRRLAARMREVATLG